MEYTKSSEFKKQKIKPCLKIEDTVIFNVNGVKYEGIVLVYDTLVFINIEKNAGNNGIVFEKLGLNPFTFVEEIQGYNACPNPPGKYWPYSTTLEDLTKVVKKLLQLCEKLSVEYLPSGVYTDPIPISVGFTQFEKGYFYSIGKTIFQCWTVSEMS